MSFRKVFVTGGTGFIGKHLVNQLVASGIEVRCLVRESSDRTGLPETGIEYVTAHLSETRALRQAVTGVDAVLHLAGLTKSLNRETLWKVNRDGTASLASVLADLPSPPTWVVVSSLAAAGPLVQMSPEESSDLANVDGFRVRTEADPNEPVSDYGRSKLDAELEAMAVCHHVPVSFVRPPIVFGPRDRDVLEMFKPIARLGMHVVPTRKPTLYSAIAVEDLCRAIIAVAKQGRRIENRQSDEGIYFAASPEVVSYQRLGEMVGESLGRSRTRSLLMPAFAVRATAAVNETISRIKGKPHILGWDKSREATTRGWACDSQKLISQCGMTFPADLAKRLRETARWYRERGWL